MSALAILLAQLATPTAAQNPPDIELRARVRAERVEMAQQGEAKLELSVLPGEAEPVQVERSAPAGQSRYRNLTINLKAAARIADPKVTATASARQEPTGEPE